MPVFYRLHQDQSVGTKRSGKWYARMVPTATINTRILAEIIQRNCTVKKSDVMAVIEELVEVMKDQMQDSKRVKLDGFGSFKIGINCKGARSAKAFTVNDNIEDLHVVFTPERTTFCLRRQPPSTESRKRPRVYYKRQLGQLWTT